MSQGTITPCGGCGESNPSRRCFGCHHDFGDTTSAWVREKEPAMTPATPPVLYISADTSDLTTRYKATPRMHPRANAWIPRDAVRVKPLEWTAHSEVVFVAPAMPMTYTVWLAPKGGRAELVAGWPRSGMMVLWRLDDTSGTEASLKAAAQADFEARIMSALAALPAPDEGEQGEGERNGV